MTFEKDHFFLRVDFTESNGDDNQVQVGTSFDDGKQKKLVKFNQKTIKSYRELVSHYRIISLSEDDLQLVQGAPEYRRLFLNQLLVLFEPNTTLLLKKHKQVLENRNKLLAQLAMSRKGACDQLHIWTKQLWEVAREIQVKRIYYLKELEGVINKIFKKNFPNVGGETSGSISFKYFIKNKTNDKTFEEFFKKYQQKILGDELRWGRSLFGIHLDDFAINYQDRQARQFASRGQQKLVLFLVKIALAQELEKRGQQAALLLDDFLTDLDNDRLSDCLKLLSEVPCQTFVTCPLKEVILDHLGDKRKEVQVVHL